MRDKGRDRELRNGHPLKKFARCYCHVKAPCQSSIGKIRTKQMPLSDAFLDGLVASSCNLQMRPSPSDVNPRSTKPIHPSETFATLCWITQSPRDPRITTRPRLPRALVARSTGRVYTCYEFVEPVCGLGYCIVQCAVQPITQRCFPIYPNCLHYSTRVPSYSIC